MKTNDTSQPVAPTSKRKNDLWQRARDAFERWHVGQPFEISKESSTWISAYVSALKDQQSNTPETAVGRPPVPGLRYDVVGWACSVCGAWNGPGEKFCAHPNRPEINRPATAAKASEQLCNWCSAPKSKWATSDCISVEGHR